MADARMLAVFMLLTISTSLHAQSALRVGFGEADLTPKVGKDHKPVFLAGFGKNRIATGIHDPIMCRAVVLDDGTRKVAVASVDVVGLFLPAIERIRAALPGIEYVLVSSTHNHEGPDTMGLWGPSLFQSGVDPDYGKSVEADIVAAIQRATKNLTPAQARFGTARAPELLHDNREPYIKHDEIVALKFANAERDLGIVVQWNCHPETLDSKNTLVSADFVAGTVQFLKDKFRCPVVYLTGTVGGLMTSLHVPIADEKGKPMADGTFEKTLAYGREVGKRAENAIHKSEAIALVPFDIRRRSLFLPVDNQYYLLARKLGVVERPIYLWKDDPTKAEPVEGIPNGKRLCLRTEIGYLKLGDLEVAAVPGEIYPELVLGKVEETADPGADFPDAKAEPSIYGSLKGRRMIVGLANDEIGYILPKRQWDEKPPFCYGRKKAQYGEVNSLGPETGPLLCEAFRLAATR